MEAIDLDRESTDTRTATRVFVTLRRFRDADRLDHDEDAALGEQ